VVGLVLTMFLLFVLVITGTAVLTAGGAATALMASLEQGLPDVKVFDKLTFAQPTKVYDRDRTRTLAVFRDQNRLVVTFDKIPELVLDATTVVEDRSFWENEGYDLQSTVFATLASVTGAADRGGASTITQQLVRAVLLPKALLEPGADLYERKAKELIQSAKLTSANPGVGGKQRIITAYLNQIFYGNNAYGIAAAAKSYFNKTMDELTLGEAALLAGLPQSPAILNPFRFADTVNRKGNPLIVVPTCEYGDNLLPVDPDCTVIQPVARRDFILRALLDGFGKWTKPTKAEVIKALNEPIILAQAKPNHYTAPHFVIAVKQRLDQLVRDGEPVESGGYDVTTTLDLRAQNIAQKYLLLGAVLPNLGVKRYYKALKVEKVSSADRSWMNILRGKRFHNGALVAMDYRTGDVLAYAGSADYYDKYKQKSKAFDPKYDVAGLGYRQPGSAWKPIVYTSAFDERVLTPGSVLLDITTPFAPGWTPANADNLNRGPVLARFALQQSLNIPAIRVMARLGNKALSQYASKASFTFGSGLSPTRVGLAAAIGTLDVRPIDMVAAYGAFGNQGEVTAPRFVLKVKGADGKTIFNAGAPQTRKVWSPQAAWLMANILSGNSNPAENPIWGREFLTRNGPGGQRRIMALKTGTTNGIKDVSTYGILPQPTNPKAIALAVGVWMGNSDHSSPSFKGAEVFSMASAGKVWRGFVRSYSGGWPVVDFKRPKGVVQKTIDKFTGGKPGTWTRGFTQEWFITGTEPGSKGAVDKAGLMYEERCGTWVVDMTNADGKNAPDTWKSAVRGYMRRVGRYAGGPIAPPGTGCYVAPTPKPLPTPDPNATPDPNPGPTPKPGKTPKPTQKPDKTPKPKPTKKPGNNSGPGTEPQAVVTDTVAVTAAMAVQRAASSRPVTPSLPLPPIQGQPVDVPGTIAAQPIRAGRRRTAPAAPHRRTTLPA